ncbi:MAG: flagellar export chaperone FliS [Myxococcota bacterium]
MRGIHRYKQSRNQSSSKAHLVVMLYQESIQRLLKAERALGSHDGHWLSDVHHARAIILELMGGLDDKQAPEFCAQMRALYGWSLEELIAVGRDKDPAHLANVRDVLTTLLDGWRVAARGPALAAV